LAKRLAGHSHVSITFWGSQKIGMPDVWMTWDDWAAPISQRYPTVLGTWKSIIVHKAWGLVDSGGFILSIYYSRMLCDVICWSSSLESGKGDDFEIWLFSVMYCLKGEHFAFLGLQGWNWDKECLATKSYKGMVLSILYLPLSSPPYPSFCPSFQGVHSSLLLFLGFSRIYNFEILEPGSVFIYCQFWRGLGVIRTQLRGRTVWTSL